MSTLENSEFGQETKTDIVELISKNRDIIREKEMRVINDHEAKVAIIGAGAFGTALAATALGGGCHVTLFATLPEKINRTLQHSHLEYCEYEIKPELPESFAAFDLILFAVPTQGLRGVCRWMREILLKRHGSFSKIPKLYLVSVTKGIEQKTLLLPSQIIEEEFKELCFTFGALSGPSFAAELRAGLPTSVVLASSDSKLIARGQHLLHRSFFRVYESDDVIGVELAGALKNVIAIVAGICDGMGLGNNARAAVITRGFGEIVQIGVHLGAKHITFLGLSGLGDLMLTSTGDLSRNRQFGLRIAKGEMPEQIITALGQVVEGVTTSQSAYDLSKKYALDTPVINGVYKVLYENLSVRNAVISLISREKKGEFDWYLKSEKDL